MKSLQKIGFFFLSGNGQNFTVFFFLFFFFSKGKRKKEKGKKGKKKRKEKKRKKKRKEGWPFSSHFSPLLLPPSSSSFPFGRHLLLFHSSSSSSSQSLSLSPSPFFLLSSSCCYTSRYDLCRRNCYARPDVPLRQKKREKKIALWVF